MTYSDRRLAPKFAKVPDGTEVAMARKKLVFKLHVITRRPPARYRHRSGRGVVRSAGDKIYTLGRTTTAGISSSG